MGLLSMIFGGLTGSGGGSGGGLGGGSSSGGGLLSKIFSQDKQTLSNNSAENKLPAPAESGNTNPSAFTEAKLPPPGPSTPPNLIAKPGLQVGDSNPTLQAASAYLGQSTQNDTYALHSFFQKSLGPNAADPSKSPWCAEFANSVLAKQGINGTGSMMAKSFLQWGKPVSQPSPGDIAVLSRGGANAPTGHVGFFAGYDANGNVKILGGNQGKGAVSIETFDPNRVLGYRAPPTDPNHPAVVASSLGYKKDGAFNKTAPNVGGLPTPLQGAGYKNAGDPGFTAAGGGPASQLPSPMKGSGYKPAIPKSSDGMTNYSNITPTTPQNAALVQHLDKMQSTMNAPMPGIGDLSKKYESGPKGDLAINPHDPVMPSYGRYQIASGTGTMNDFLKNSGYQTKFSGMTPGTPQFNNQWVLMSHDPAFVKSQTDFISKSLYAPLRSSATKLGVPNTQALNQVLFAMAVQHGPGGAEKIIKAAGISQADGPSTAIMKLYNARMSQFSAYKSRYVNEETDALKLAQND